MTAKAPASNGTVVNITTDATNRPEAFFGTTSP